MDSFLERLQSEGIEVVGVEESYRDVIVDDYDAWKAPFDMWPYNIIMHLEGEEVERPTIIVRPSSGEEVAEVLKLASEHGICIIPACGLSNVVGATRPSRNCVFLDTSGMDEIIEFNPDDRFVIVEAGVRVGRLVKWLEDKGYTLPYRPQSERIACIGGSISTQGAGAFSPGLGNIEDVVLWMEVATPTGRRLILGSRRSPRGIVFPGVNMVYFGGEGAFGVITRVALRVLEKPESDIEMAYLMNGFAEAVKAARKIYSWDPPTMMRIQDEREAQLYYGVEEAVVLVGVEGPSRVAEAKAMYVDEILRKMGARSREGIVEEWWRNRYRYSESMKLVLSSGMAFDTIDLSAYWSRLSELHKELHGTLDSINGVSLSFSHASHFYINGGALYTTIVFGRDPQLYWKIWRAAMEIALRTGASIVHHHSFGTVREKWAMEEYSGSLWIASTLKNALDPRRTVKSGIIGRVQFNDRQD